MSTAQSADPTTAVAGRTARHHGVRRGALALCAGLLLMGTAVGCGASGESQSAATDSTAIAPGRTGAEVATDAKSGPALGPATAPDAAVVGPGGAGSVGAGSVGAGTASVIRTAEVTIEGDPRLTDKVSSAAERRGGFVSSLGRDMTGPSTVVVRVPGDQLSAYLAEISALGTVTASRQGATDVTAEVADVDSRIASARASLARLRALMSKATTVADVVTIEAELQRRESELESWQAQQRALKDQTTLATVSVTIVPPAQAPATGFAAGVRDGWDAFTRAASDGIRLVGWVLPFAVIIGLPVALVLWLRRRTKRRPASTAPEVG